MINKQILEERLQHLKDNPIRHVIGVDKSDKHKHAYCLVRIKGKGCDAEVLLSKEMKAGHKFDKEVEGLVEYFNAEVVVEV